MADKLISNLFSGDHVPPKPRMPLTQKLTITVAFIVVVSLGSFLVWKFINYREENRVTHFWEAIFKGQYDVAYASWDAGDRYKMKDFLDDFGAEGFYTKGTHEARVVGSAGQGGAVVVCVKLDKFKKQLPIRVDKESLKLGFSPVDKCN